MIYRGFILVFSILSLFGKLDSSPPGVSNGGAVPRFTPRDIYRAVVQNQPPGSGHGPVPPTDPAEQNLLVLQANGNPGSADPVKLYLLEERQQGGTREIANAFFYKEGDRGYLLRKLEDGNYSKIHAQTIVNPPPRVEPEEETDSSGAGLSD